VTAAAVTCRCDDDVWIDGENRSVFCPVHDVRPPPEIVELARAVRAAERAAEARRQRWHADVVIRCLLVVIAVGAGAAIRANVRVPEMFALGIVAALMALIGERSWRT